MIEPEDMQARFARLVDALGGEPDVAVGQRGKKGFGSSALQAGGKIFAMLTPKGEFVVKLPAGRVAQLEEAGIGRRFDPGHGRLMREWLALAPSGEEWLPFGREALQFVRGQR